MDPSEQFQILDDVLYVKEGVVTKIAGYRWSETVGQLPTIVAYELMCGVAVPRDAIKRIEFDRLQERGDRTAVLPCGHKCRRCVSRRRAGAAAG